MVSKQWHTWKIVQKPLSKCSGIFSMHTQEKPLNKNEHLQEPHLLPFLFGLIPISFITQKLSNNLYFWFEHKGYDCYRKEKKRSIFSLQTSATSWVKKSEAFRTYSCIVMAGHVLFKFLLWATGSRYYPESISFEINKSRIIKIRKRKNGDSCPNSNFFV